MKSIPTFQPACGGGDLHQVHIGFGIRIWVYMLSLVAPWQDDVRGRRAAILVTLLKGLGIVLINSMVIPSKQEAAEQD